MIDELTQDYVRELFEYRGGNLYWRVAKARCIKVGDIAGTIDINGYRKIQINGKQCYGHRIIFLYHNGYLPEFLDHIDGDPTNNNISNLRPATTSQNYMNQKKTKLINGKQTSSRYKGVYWNKPAGKWHAHIKIDRKMKHLGSFTSEIEAASAYDVAATKYFGKFARLNFDA